jgi:hypothetical protein
VVGLLKVCSRQRPACSPALFKAFRSFVFAGSCAPPCGMSQTPMPSCTMSSARYPTFYSHGFRQLRWLLESTAPRVWTKQIKNFAGRCLNRKFLPNGLQSCPRVSSTPSALISSTSHRRCPTVGLFVPSCPLIQQCPSVVAAIHFLAVRCQYPRSCISAKRRERG